MYFTSLTYPTKDSKKRLDFKKLRDAQKVNTLTYRI